MAEQWRPVTGLEGRYEVSDRGRVRSKTRMVRDSRGSIRRINGKMLKPRKSGNAPWGYWIVYLPDGKGWKNRYVHRLVLEAFKGPCPPTYEAMHLNDNGWDNRLENLVWGPSKINRDTSKSSLRKR